MSVALSDGYYCMFKKNGVSSQDQTYRGDDDSEIDGRRMMEDFWYDYLYVHTDT